MERAVERPMATFDAVELLAEALPLPPHARDRHSSFMNADVEIFAAHSRHFGRDDELLRGFLDVHGRHPAVRSGRIAVQALLDGQQVADGIPAGKGHKKCYDLK